MPRLFFAIDSPTAFKKELIKLQDEIAIRLHMLKLSPNFKPEKLINSHCTIRFLGNIEESNISKLSREVSHSIGETRIASFEFSLGSYGMFVRQHRARVLWIGLEPVEPFRQIHNAIDGGLAAAHLSIEAEHSFRPHLTLFRFRESYHIPKDFEFPHLASTSLSTIASEVLLIESRTLPSGPVHTIRERFPLVTL